MSLKLTLLLHSFALGDLLTPIGRGIKFLHSELYMGGRALFCRIRGTRREIWDGINIVGILMDDSFATVFLSVLMLLGI